MKTILELENYLEDECYSFSGISIGKHQTFEGLVIRKEKNRFIFGYVEKGVLDVIQSFIDEKDLVQYALKELKKDNWYKGHLVAWTWTKEEIEAAEQELIKMNIEYKRNDIPDYSKHERAYRIFVFGKDVIRLTDFKEKFLLK